MTHWWTPETGTYLGAFGGAGLGLVGAIVGTLCGYLVPRNKGRGIVLGMLGAMVLIGVGLLSTGVVALVFGQPDHVWYPPTLMGFISAAVGTPLFFVLRARYVGMEQKKMDAELLRKS
jgi:MFS family permease